MPIELGVWRIDGEATRIEVVSLDQEERLETLLDNDIGIASPNWMVIGRQVPTDLGKRIDLLAIDGDGNLVVIELKRDTTPREVVAQLLDYGSWVRTVEDSDIAVIYDNYKKAYHADKAATSLDDAFRQRFKVRELPETLNTSHELVVVASALDPSTERIVTYLAEEHGVDINAIFFRVFRDGDREYLNRLWLIDPLETKPPPSEPGVKEPWNGEFYVSFGEGSGRLWKDAIEYGFISAGGGSWYSKTLHLLEPGGRVWVNVPGTGYVGVGRVMETVVKVDKFMVQRDDGTEVPITEMPVTATDMFTYKDSEEMAEYLVRVNWIKTVPLDGAIKEKGFFGNQNSVCKPTTRTWSHTVDRLKKRFGID